MKSASTPRSRDSANARMRPGHVFWFFGLSGAGKTTLATVLAERLQERDWPVLLLDGDVLRAGLCRDLGYSDQERTENIRRAAELAKLALAQRQVVVAAFITPRESLRRLAGEIIGREKLALIWVDTPLTLCRQRDPKGLYQLSAAGNLPLFSGVSSVFEKPADHDLRLQTDQRSPVELCSQLEDFCHGRLASKATDP